MFIHTERGDYWRVDQIKYFVVRDGYVYGVTDDEDCSVDLPICHRSSWPAALHEATAQAVPCAPGHYVLVPGEDVDGTVCASLSPVVAWRIGCDGMVLAVPYDYWARDSNAVLFPDGRVIESDGAEYDNLQNYEAQLRREHAERQQKASKRRAAE